MTEELFQDDPYLKSCDAVVTSVDAKKRCFSVDCTVFYPMGGGQPGDTGVAFHRNDDEIGIRDTRRHRTTGEIEHYVEDRSELPAVGDQLHMKIDWERRHRLMRLHSCMHLLCAIVPGRVTGGQIYDGRARLDFDIAHSPDKKQLTHDLRLLIRQNADRAYESYTMDELKAFPDLLDSLSVPPPDIQGDIRLVHFNEIDIQPCGGTHVANTGEIGRIRVTRIENKGRHNRRITIAIAD